MPPHLYCFKNLTEKAESNATTRNSTLIQKKVKFIAYLSHLFATHIKARFTKIMTYV